MRSTRCGSGLALSGALLGLGLAAPVAQAATIEGGVAGLKLILLDKYGAGKAKAVYVAKDDPDIVKGPDGDPPGLAGTVKVIDLSDPSNQAVYQLGGAGWLVNESTVAKFVDKTAAPGGPGVKVAVVKPGSVGKVVAKNLGDGDGTSGDQGSGDLDLQAFDGSETIRVVVSVDNANDGNTYVFCSDFTDLTVKQDASDQPFKVISKTSTAPASCAVCGDGVPVAGEACDDGNTIPGDGCRADCTVEACGDGIVDAGEACDDGNAFGGDGCRTDCTPELCGDGILDPQEQCDDGNTTPGDGCNATCESEANTCAPAIGGRLVTVSIDTPVALAALRLDLEYPQIHTSIPGSGNSSLVNGRVTIFPTGGQTIVNDKDTDLSVVLANATAFIDSGPVFEVDFDECTDLALNMCNRAQNVVGCCDNPGDPSQFGDVCQQRECTNLPGTVCTVANELATCGLAGACQPKPCTSDASCTGGFGTCVFKCPANPPVCPVGLFPTSSVGPCQCAVTCGANLVANTTAAGDDDQLVALGGACASANTCVVGLGPNGAADTIAASGDTGVAGSCPGDNVCVGQSESTTCSVSDPADDMGNPVEGVTCSVNVIQVP